MKPRLPVAPLTLEDWEVWYWNAGGWSDIPRMMLMDACKLADRRDADLMYECAIWSDVLSRFVRGRPPARMHIDYYHRFLATGERPPGITNFA